MICEHLKSGRKTNSNGNFCIIALKRNRIFGLFDFVSAAEKEDIQSVSKSQEGVSAAVLMCFGSRLFFFLFFLLFFKKEKMVATIKPSLL